MGRKDIYAFRGASDHPLPQEIISGKDETVETPVIKKILIPGALETACLQGVSTPGG